MENSKFKVGQKWEMRNGAVATIHNINLLDPHPIKTGYWMCYDKNGRWLDLQTDHKYDLVKLVENLA